MSNPVVLTESTKTPFKRSGKRWRVVIAKPGQGTSGKYSAQMLEEYGSAALAPGAKAFFDHDPKRSIKDMVGTYPDGAFWDATNQELVAELQPFKHWQEVIDEIGPHAEASIYMMGEKDEDDNVTSLIPHRTNGVDLVGYGGLEGSGLKEQVENLIEAAHTASTKPGSEASGQVNKKEKMTDEEIQAAVKAAVAEALAPVLTFISESKAAKTEEIQGKADADAVSAAVTEAVAVYKDKEKLINDANLLPSQAESIREAALAGAEVAPLIEAAKKILDEAKGLVTTGGEIVRVGESTKNEDYTMAGVRL
jgi:hypothetical protein